MFSSGEKPKLVLTNWSKGLQNNLHTLNDEKLLTDCNSQNQMDITNSKENLSGKKLQENFRKKDKKPSKELYVPPAARRQSIKNSLAVSEESRICPTLETPGKKRRASDKWKNSIAKSTCPTSAVKCWRSTSDIVCHHESSGASEDSDGEDRTFTVANMSCCLDENPAPQKYISRRSLQFSSLLLAAERTSDSFSSLKNVSSSDPDALWADDFLQRCNKYQVGYIDSHCHIDFLFRRLNYRQSFQNYRQDNSSMFPSNYEGCIAVFCQPQSFTPLSGLWKSSAEEDGVWIAFGCHPKFATEYNDTVESNLRRCLGHPKVVAAGEFGLDYSGHFYQYKDIQKLVFVRQLKIARDLDLPLVIHCREAEDDTFDIMKKYVSKRTKIHRHCFTGNYEMAERWLHHFPNLYVGLTNLVSFPSAVGSHDLARKIPLNRLLLETDAPYFVPRNTPKNSFQCSNPGMAVIVAEEVARIRGISVDEVLSACRTNTRLAYGI